MRTYMGTMLGLISLAVLLLHTEGGINHVVKARISGFKQEVVNHDAVITMDKGAQKHTELNPAEKVSVLQFMLARFFNEKMKHVTDKDLKVITGNRQKLMKEHRGSNHRVETPKAKLSNSRFNRISPFIG